MVLDFDDVYPVQLSCSCRYRLSMVTYRKSVSGGPIFQSEDRRTFEGMIKLLSYRRGPSTGSYIIRA